MLKLLKLPPPPLMLAFLAYLNRSGSISCSCVDLVALLLSGLEQGVDQASASVASAQCGGRGTPSRARVECGALLLW